MQNILQAPFLLEFCRILNQMYRLGWAERNGGNLSLLLDEGQIAPYLDTERVARTLPIALNPSDAQALAGRIFLVTGTGCYFRNMLGDPQGNCGVLRVSADGRDLQVLWGFEPDGSPTSETLPHLMCHAVRLEADSGHRVVLHTHSPGILAMTFVHPLDDRSFTRSLWRLNTECIQVFPEGVGVMPWMVGGTSQAAEATAAKMRETRLVVWPHHGVWGAGRNIDEAFGLVETAEKHAQLYLSLAHLPRLQQLTDDNLRQIAAHFGLTVREEWLV